MIRILLLSCFLFLPATVMAQEKKDSLPKPVTKVKLSSKQQQWLNANYKKIAVLKKDSAAKIVRTHLTSISEASLDYLLSQATKLLQGDRQKELALLKQMLTQLKQQKQALLQRIREKEEQLNRETDPAKRRSIESSIEELRRQLRQVEENINTKEREVRKAETE